MELREGGAKVKSKGQRPEMEQWTRWQEAEPGNTLSKAELMTGRSEAHLRSILELTMEEPRG